MAPLTSPSPSTTDSRQTIARQHDELRELVRALPTTRDLVHLAARLGELRARLEDHYAVEEGPDGLYEIVVTRAPRHHTRVQRLFDEHRDLLRRVDAIVTKTRAILDGPAADVHRDVAELVRVLDAHEVRETAMLGDAMYCDNTGCGG